MVINRVNDEYPLNLFLRLGDTLIKLLRCEGPKLLLLSIVFCCKYKLISQLSYMENTKQRVHYVIPELRDI